MKPCLKVLSLVLVAFAGCNSGNRGNSVSNKLDINGRWGLVEEVYDGKSRGVGRGAFFYNFYPAGSMSIYFDGAATRIGTFTIDQDSNPKQIVIMTMEFVSTMMKTEVEPGEFQPERKEKHLQRGIVEIRDGKIRICVVNDPDLPRPTRFESKKGDRRTLYTFERRDWPDDLKNYSEQDELHDSEEQ
jgi:uncharacterized protein (TIGR03067 family)